MSMVTTRGRGYLAHCDRFAGMTVAIVLCGADIDTSVLKEIL